MMGSKWIEKIRKWLGFSQPEAALFQPEDRLALLKEDARMQIAFIRQANIATPSGEKKVIELSSHWNGYVREAAVRRLAEAKSKAALSALVERMNDWVPQVREAAVRASGSFVQPENLDSILSCLRTILALTGKSRADHSLFLARIEALLGMREFRRTVLQHFVQSHGREARYLLNCMLKCEGQDAAKLMEEAARHRDFTVRAACIQWCDQHECDGATLRAMLADANAKNRKSAFMALWKKEPDAGERSALLEAVLMDESPSVREVGLWYAQKTGFDVPAYLRRQVRQYTGEQRKDVGLLGLMGTVADQQFSPVLRHALTSPQPDLRRAALSSWVKVSRTTADADVADALGDPAGKVWKLAIGLVRKQKVVLSQQQLSGAAGNAMNHRRINRYVAIVQQMAFWDRFEALVEGLQYAQSPDEQRQMICALQAWKKKQRYAFSSLPEEQRHRLKTLIAQSNLENILKNHSDLHFALQQFE